MRGRQKEGEGEEEWEKGIGEERDERKERGRKKDRWGERKKERHRPKARRRKGLGIRETKETKQ